MAKTALPHPSLSSLVIPFRFLGHLQWLRGEDVAPRSRRQSNENEHSWLPVFSPSHAQTLFQTKVTKAFKPHTWGEVSQDPSTVLLYFENSQTWPGHSWGPQLPAAFWQQARMAASPASLSLLPTSLLAVAVVVTSHSPCCALSPSKSGVLYSHQLLCKPRPMLYTLRSVKGEGSLRQTQLSSKSPSLEFMWTSSSELEGTSPPGHLIHFSPLPSTVQTGNRHPKP